MLKNPNAEWPHLALCTHKRGNHTVRSKHFRYIRYQDGSEELYDHRSDPHEWNNLVVSSPQTAQNTIKKLSPALPKSEAPTGPSYYAGSALMKLDGDKYQWATRKNAQGNPEFQNANKLKQKA
ncbi:hypothetical protein [Rubritalea tangerina]|uniref:DUF4976 domain-containing protein n=1 Tax=Rubritalea tangerina TaxID=430798 RepID=A0ABW4Z6S7_9BACT